MTYEEALHSYKIMAYMLPISVSEKVVEALEKQIPKKPIIEKTNYGYGYVGVRDDDYTFICPICKEEINIYDNYHYCVCGQRIDWDEYE